MVLNTKKIFQGQTYILAIICKIIPYFRNIKSICLSDKFWVLPDML